MKLKKFLCICFIFINGCSQLDPLYMSGKWNASSSGQKNLISQIENKKDLIIGRNEISYDGFMAFNAIKKLREGKVKKMMEESTSSVGNNN